MAVASKINKSRRDPETENIIRTYLPENKEGKVFSVKRLNLKKTLRRISYLVLGIAFFLLLAYLVSSKRIQISVDLTRSQNIRSPKTDATEFPVDRSIATIYFARGASNESRIKANEVVLVLEPNSKKAILVYNFRQPVDFSAGYIRFGACSFDEKVRLRIILKDDKFLSNTDEEDSIYIGPKSERFALVPKNERSGINLARVKELKLELELASEATKSAGVYIRELSFLRKTK